MFSRRPAWSAGCLVLLFTVAAWAQAEHYTVPAASVRERFAAYDEALSAAAERQLAAASAESPAAALSTNSREAQQLDATRLRGFAQQYWNGKEQDVRRAAQRLRELRSTIDPILQQEGVPRAVAAVVLVESGGRSTALSPKGALGLWQFMPETARRYGLAVNPERDERLDPTKSTRAAARYLRDLYAQFGDWKLTFAAYNAGEQAIQRALGRHRVRDFESLRQARLLPEETSHYVPAVLAAADLMDESSMEHGSAKHMDHVKSLSMPSHDEGKTPQ